MQEEEEEETTKEEEGTEEEDVVVEVTMTEVNHQCNYRKLLLWRD